ncbi:MAG: ArsR family transcriptional regulator [Thermoplasmata archaeon]|nr:ArsR family transcriptional regulator [Thermoplasmata archaeon]
MNLVSLFGSRERLKILEHVMSRKGLRVTDIAKELNVSKGLVSKFMRTLLDSGIVRKSDGAFYSPSDSYATRQIKRVINLSKVNLRRIDRKMIDGMGIYGSWARGTNTIESDADIWVKAEEYPPQEYLAKLSAQLRRIFGCEIRLLVLTPTKTQELMKDDVFFSALTRDSVLLWGEDIA